MSLRDSYRQHRRAYLIGTGCLLLILCYWAYAHAKSKDVKYTTATVRRGDITAAVQATGTINALTTVSVGSYVSGTVQYIFADFNTKVKSGQVLAQLDPAIYEAQVTQAQGQLENAQDNLATLAANVQVDQANLAKSQANVVYQKATAKRSEDLFQAGVVSADANELTQSTMGQAVADVQSAQAQLDQAKATLTQARSQVVSMEGALQAAETSLKYIQRQAM